MKTKYQEYEDTYNLNEPEVINELDDVHEFANEQVTGGKGISAKWLGVSNQFYNFEVNNAKVWYQIQSMYEGSHVKKKIMGISTLVQWKSIFEVFGIMIMGWTYDITVIKH